MSLEACSHFPITCSQKLLFDQSLIPLLQAEDDPIAPNDGIPREKIMVSAFTIAADCPRCLTPVGRSVLSLSSHKVCKGLPGETTPSGAFQE